jgi:hypothetical protein
MTGVSEPVALSDILPMLACPRCANSPFKLGQGINLSNRSHGDFLYTLAKGFGSNVTAVGKGKTLIDGILKT